MRTFIELLPAIFDVLTAILLAVCLLGLLSICISSGLFVVGGVVACFAIAPLAMLSCDVLDIIDGTFN